MTFKIHEDTPDKSNGSKCDELKGYIPTKLTCETRGRVTFPTVGSYDKEEIKPVRKAQQGGNWDDYNDKCVDLGFPRVERPPITTTTSTVKPQNPSEDVSSWNSSKSRRPTGTSQQTKP